MKIYLANPRGFCAGVDRAIEIVERAIEKHGSPIYVRHEVVHNTYVVNNLKNKGAIFVEELEDMVFTPINLQLNAINEMKLKLVERENIKTILDKKEKVLKKIRNMNTKKVKNYNQKLKESEDEYNNLLQEYNSVHQYLFDTMNGLSTYKGSIVLNVLNGLKKAQLRFFSNATASLRVCVKNLTSKVSPSKAYHLRAGQLRWHVL